MPMSVEVSGMTPNGAFEGQYVWYGYHPPCCHPEDYTVYISPEPVSMLGWSGDESGEPGAIGLSIVMNGTAWTPMAWLGEGPATFRAGTHTIESTITIDTIDTVDGYDNALNLECYEGEQDWSTLVGSFNVVGDGWDLVGSFSAPLCSSILLIHPC
jgi:hypothetical protein